MTIRPTSWWDSHGVWCVRAIFLLGWQEGAMANRLIVLLPILFVAKVEFASHLGKGSHSNFSRATWLSPSSGLLNGQDDRIRIWLAVLCVVSKKRISFHLTGTERTLKKVLECKNFTNNDPFYKKSQTLAIKSFGCIVMEQVAGPASLTCTLLPHTFLWYVEVISPCPTGSIMQGNAG